MTAPTRAAPEQPQTSPLSKLGMAETAAAVAEAIAKTDVVLAEAEEGRAVAIADALRAAAPDACVVYLPATDAFPGENAPATPANIGQRLSALRRMRATLEKKRKRPRIVCVTTGEALASAYPPPSALGPEPLRVDAGANVDLDELVSDLETHGYIRDERVDEPGEVALHGQVLDVFPADAGAPLRVEIGQDGKASLRIYDPADQRTIADCDSREIGPAVEPAIGSTPTVLLDHLPAARLAITPEADQRRLRILALAEDASAQGRGSAKRAVAGSQALDRALARHKRLIPERAGEPPPRFAETRNPFKRFGRVARAALDGGERVVLLGSARDLRFLRPRAEAATKADITDVASWAEVRGAPPGSLLALEMLAERGFARPGVLAIAAADLIGSRAELADAAGQSTGSPLSGLGEMRIGDVVVHEAYGVGILSGLQRPSEDADGPGSEAIRLAYANEGVRLLRADEADRLWRYGAEADAVALDRLDGSSWATRREKIEAAIAQTALGLAELAADRAGRLAPALEPETAAYERFSERFPFAETQDQARSIEAVRADLASGRPMDRLVVGDVGYGKTEVALRATAMAALAGWQVAVAAPTTVLARQHLETFTARFAGTGIVVAGLSRLSSASERKAVKAGLADGSVGVVVGTGAVAGKGVAFARLGLVIVDEEQRFGAADKTRLRGLSAGHVLTLSATPIPRTLQTALIGLQDLSVIATPPARRQPIRTVVGPFAPETVRAALMREKARGGQSFVVVPRIGDMAALSITLATLVPGLTVREAHGKLPAAEIDEAMIAFGRGDGDILLATNIIEAGLDVPRANTMVVWSADRLGLAQLHQLRGRVGRGSRRGQVLLLTDPKRAIAPRTLKRLRTLAAFDRLGAGFAISARDLDLRGAGDLLGDDQAGHMKLVGVDLYQQLLGMAVRRARGEDVERWSPELRLGVEGVLPATWIADEELRVAAYVRLARLSDPGELESLEAELEDRFGAIPDQARVLLAVARIRVFARMADVAEIVAGPEAIAFKPRTSRSLAADGIELKSKDGRLLLREAIPDVRQRLDRLSDVLDELRSA